MGGLVWQPVSTATAPIKASRYALVHPLPFANNPVHCDNRLVVWSVRFSNIKLSIQNLTPRIQPRVPKPHILKDYIIAVTLVTNFRTVGIWPCWPGPSAAFGFIGV